MVLFVIHDIHATKILYDIKRIKIVIHCTVVTCYKKKKLYDVSHDDIIARRFWFLVKLAVLLVKALFLSSSKILNRAVQMVVSLLLYLLQVKILSMHWKVNEFFTILLLFEILLLNPISILSRSLCLVTGIRSLCWWYFERKSC